MGVGRRGRPSEQAGHAEPGFLSTEGCRRGITRRGCKVTDGPGWGSMAGAGSVG